MARLARIVIPHYPHHIIQRGNRRQKVFFTDEDKSCYLDYLRIYAQSKGIEFWAYCLMDNHVHLIAVPHTEESFSLGIGEAHRRYTTRIHARTHWRGYLWQGRFLSYPLDSSYLYAAIRYVECNPMRAGLVKKAEDYSWSSAKVHVLKKKHSLLSEFPLLSEIENWSEYLSEGNKEEENKLLSIHSKTGRPLGNTHFVETLEQITGRVLQKIKPGPKKIPLSL